MASSHSSALLRQHRRAAQADDLGPDDPSLHTGAGSELPVSYTLDKRRHIPLSPLPDLSRIHASFLEHKKKLGRRDSMGFYEPPPSLLSSGSTRLSPTRSSSMGGGGARRGTAVSGYGAARRTSFVVAPSGSPSLGGRIASSEIESYVPTSSVFWEIRMRLWRDLLALDLTSITGISYAHSLAISEMPPSQFAEFRSRVINAYADAVNASVGRYEAQLQGMMEAGVYDADINHTRVLSAAHAELTRTGGAVNPSRVVTSVMTAWSRERAAAAAAEGASRRRGSSSSVAGGEGGKRLSIADVVVMALGAAQDATLTSTAVTRDMRRASVHRRRSSRAPSVTGSVRGELEASTSPTQQQHHAPPVTHHATAPLDSNLHARSSAFWKASVGSSRRGDDEAVLKRLWAAERGCLPTSVDMQQTLAHTVQTALEDRILCVGHDLKSPHAAAAQDAPATTLTRVGAAPSLAASASDSGMFATAFARVMADTDRLEAAKRRKKGRAARLERISPVKRVNTLMHRMASVPLDAVTPASQHAQQEPVEVAHSSVIAGSMQVHVTTGVRGIQRHVVGPAPSTVQHAAASKPLVVLETDPHAPLTAPTLMRTTTAAAAPHAASTVHVMCAPVFRRPHVSDTLTRPTTVAAVASAATRAASRAESRPASRITTCTVETPAYSAQLQSELFKRTVSTRTAHSGSSGKLLAALSSSASAPVLSTTRAVVLHRMQSHGATFKLTPPVTHDLIRIQHRATPMRSMPPRSPLRVRAPTSSAATTVADGVPQSRGNDSGTPLSPGNSDTPTVDAELFSAPVPVRVPVAATTISDLLRVWERLQMPTAARLDMAARACIHVHPLATLLAHWSAAADAVTAVECTRDVLHAWERSVGAVAVTLPALTQPVHAYLTQHMPDAVEGEVHEHAAPRTCLLRAVRELEALGVDVVSRAGTSKTPQLEVHTSVAACLHCVFAWCVEHAIQVCDTMAADVDEVVTFRGAPYASVLRGDPFKRIPEVELDVG